MSLRDVKHAPVWPLLLLFLVYPYFRHMQPVAGSDTEPRDELRALYLARAVTENFTLKINDVVKQHGDLPGKLHLESDTFAPGAPGLALVIAPPLLVARAAAWVFNFDLSNVRALRYLRVVVSIIPTCIVLIAFFAFLVRRTVHAHSARFGVLAFALSAPIWVFATGISAAHLTGMCLLACFMLLGDENDWPSRGSFVLSGILSGIAVMLTYAALPLVIVFTVYAFTRARHPQWVIGYLFPVFFAVAAVVAYHAFTIQTLFYVVERTATDGSQVLALWGLHGPNTDGLVSQLVGNLGVLRWAPVLVLIPLGLFVMAGRGDLAEAAVIGLSILFVMGVASGEPPSAEPSFGVTLTPILLALGVWPLARSVEALAGVAAGSLAAGTLGCWSLLQSVALVATHVHVPVSYTNPLRDLSVAMLRDGVYAPSLGHGVGLHGDMAVMPVFLLVFALACVLSLGGAPLEEGNGTRRILSGVILGAAALYWQLSWSPEPNRRERYLDTLAIERAAEHDRSADARLVRQAQKLTGETTPESKLARGHAATAFGDNASALEFYREIQSAPN
jgi:hypothetical protein